VDHVEEQLVKLPLAELTGGLRPGTSRQFHLLAKTEPKKGDLFPDAISGPGPENAFHRANTAVDVHRARCDGVVEVSGTLSAKPWDVTHLETRIPMASLAAGCQTV
jgi:hypothetical protein